MKNKKTKSLTISYSKLLIACLVFAFVVGSLTGALCFNSELKDEVLERNYLITGIGEALQICIGRGGLVAGLKIDSYEEEGTDIYDITVDCAIDEDIEQVCDEVYKGKCLIDTEKSIQREFDEMMEE